VFPEQSSMKRARFAASTFLEVPALPSSNPCVEKALVHARRLSLGCSARYQYSGAAWYAEKAVSLSGGAPDDVYALAEAQMQCGEYARAYSTLECRGYLDQSQGSSPLGPGSTRSDRLHFLYLGALCLKGMKKWGKCLELLESGMEGPGKPGLRTTLAPVPLKARAEVSSLLASLSLTTTTTTVLQAGQHSKSGGVDHQHPPPLQSPTPPPPGSDATEAVSRGGGGSSSSGAVSQAQSPGAPERSWERMDTGSPVVGGAAALSLSGRGELDKVVGGAARDSKLLEAAETRDSSSSSPCTPSPGNEVWRVLFSMALQHCDTALALSLGLGVLESGAKGAPTSRGGLPSSWSIPCGEFVSLLPNPGGETGPWGSLLSTLHGSGYVPLCDGGRMNLVSSLASLRGEVLIACDNRGRAAQWFIAALRLDPCNVTAFNVSWGTFSFFFFLPPRRQIIPFPAPSPREHTHTHNNHVAAHGQLSPDKRGGDFASWALGLAASPNANVVGLERKFCSTIPWW